MTTEALTTRHQGQAAVDPAEVRRVAPLAAERLANKRGVA